MLADGKIISNKSLINSSTGKRNTIDIICIFIIRNSNRLQSLG